MTRAHAAAAPCVARLARRQRLAGRAGPHVERPCSRSWLERVGVSDVTVVMAGGLDARPQEAQAPVREAEARARAAGVTL